MPGGTTSGSVYLGTRTCHALLVAWPLARMRESLWWLMIETVLLVCT